VHYPTDQISDQYLTEANARSVASALHSAEDRALALLPNDHIKAAMQALPRQFREAVYYADVEGLRYSEIAARMNTPRGTVMSRLHRGRGQLRTMLGSALDQGGPDTLPATA
jgi:RNA polymerase sigma-70 factor (ECF subfamily)